MTTTGIHTDDAIDGSSSGRVVPNAQPDASSDGDYSAIRMTVECSLQGRPCRVRWAHGEIEGDELWISLVAGALAEAMDNPVDVLAALDSVADSGISVCITDAGGTTDAGH